MTTLLTIDEMTKIISQIPKPYFITKLTKTQQDILEIYMLQVSLDLCTTQTDKAIEDLKSRLFKVTE